MSLETQARIEQNRVLLGGGASFSPGEGSPFERYLMHAKKDLEPLVSGKHIVVLPYARGEEMDRTLGGLSMVLRRMGARTIYSTHEYPGSENNVISDGEVIYIEGGNTGRLVANLHSLRNYDGTFVDKNPSASQTSLVDSIRDKVADGTPIVGFSAGLNVMASDIRTTNDMSAAVVRLSPRVALSRIDSLGLFPSNLNFNPHYPQKFEDKTVYVGENRAERIRDVLDMDPGRIILALREGAYITVRGMEMRLEGTMGGVIFEAGREEPQELENGDISYLIKNPESGK